MRNGCVDSRSFWTKLNQVLDRTGSKTFHHILSFGDSSHVMPVPRIEFYVQDIPIYFSYMVWQFHPDYVLLFFVTVSSSS
jgi:hypothetical protein